MAWAMKRVERANKTEEVREPAKDRGWRGTSRAGSRGGAGRERLGGNLQEGLGGTGQECRGRPEPD